MAFKSVSSKPMSNAPETSETIYPKLSEVKPGAVLAEGIYTGSHDGNFGKTYYVAQDNGIAVGLSSWGKLNYLIGLASLIPGQSRIRVTYLGMSEIADGKYAGKAAHDFNLEVDDSTVTVSDKAVNS